MGDTATLAMSNQAERLDRELTALATANFDTPEFRLFFQIPLTIAPARPYPLSLVFYNANRRDCWAYVQAKAPWDMKQAIWQPQSRLVATTKGWMQCL